MGESGKYICFTFSENEDKKRRPFGVFVAIFVFILGVYKVHYMQLAAVAARARRGGMANPGHF